MRYQPCPRCRAKGQDSRGDNLVCYPDGSAHCFACKYHVFPKHYSSRKEKVSGPKYLLPIDYTDEVPAAAWKWVLQYGIPYSHWHGKVGYSPKEERLVFRVGSPLQFAIGRYVGNASPAPRKWYVWGDSHKHAEIYGTEGALVYVEDLISANKVGLAGHTSIPLFGTEFHTPHTYAAVTTEKPIYLWLDADQEIRTRKKALWLEAIVNRGVKVIVTKHDPKELSYEEICKTIRSA